MRFRVSCLARSQPFLFAKRNQCTGRFADSPFDWMEPVAAGGDVRGADIFVRRRKVFDPLGNQRSERNLETQGGNIDVVIASGARMKVDVVAADANGIVKDGSR